MNDEITQAIDTTSKRIADAINESKLHPSVILLILQNTTNEVVRVLQKQEGNDAND